MLMSEVPAARVEGQRRMLALDGGGIRGLVSLEILASIESTLRRENDDPDLVLADYFDYFAGTSTGAMIATGLALGWPVDRIMESYLENGPHLFDPISRRRRIATRFGWKYPRSGLAGQLQQEYGAETMFGDDRFRSLLLVVVHNSTTDSPWPLSNNPRAKYNDPDLADCNLRLPLWQIVRASTAAPVYYPPEQVRLGASHFVFVDGGITPFNNPAHQLFLQATLPEYRLEWPTGEERLLLVSVGTGALPKTHPDLRARQVNLLHTIKTLPGTLLAGSSVHQDILCRATGRCVHGDPIDGELGRLDAPRPHPALFTYVRYNVSLDPVSLDALGLGHLTEPETLAGVQRLDGIDYMTELREIGRAAAGAVDATAFERFPGAA